ncbi:MAG TPA: hypothetical protein VLA77_01355 [Candidatus Saccharimonadales bacterium]|nr:hypothetical protein [Candidatus Saccharimonadales bacterium]
MDFSNTHQTNSLKSQRGKNAGVVIALSAVVLIVLLALVGFGVWKYMGADAAVAKDKYQALFLTNGQVYFGKLKNVNDKYVELTDIYYLQVQQPIQPSDTKNDQPQVSLAKLGSELHGPEDRMNVNREQVLFWENLKDDSKVVSAIKSNK